jgi:SOS-response transcriptional repressor LexA
MNPKKNIDAWIEYVYAEWLNKWEPSRLRPSITKLICRMRNTIGSRKNFDDAWKLMDEIEKLQGLLHDDTRTYSKESPHMLLECGIAAHQMGNSREAVRFLSGAITTYTDVHDNAVARWLLGCVYWHLNEPVNALSAWEKSLIDFKDLEKRTLRNADLTTWYHDRVKEMDEAIKHAADTNVPPPIHWVRPKPKNTDSKKRHLIQSLPVIGEIPAGTASSVLPEPVEFMEVNQVQLGGREYRIVSLIRGKKVVHLPLEQRFYILRVHGNSMNNATPEPIEDGDYVIMREQQTADDQEIVAAEIVSGDNKDDRATLKRFTHADGKIYLVPESTDPCFSERIDLLDCFTKFDEGFHIRGVALAVLKPLPKEAA